MWKFVFCIVLLIHLANSEEKSGAKVDPGAIDDSKLKKDEPIVKTSLGPMKGYTLKTREGRLVAAFTSIPYAAPPLKRLRFLVSNPQILNWTKIT